MKKFLRKKKTPVVKNVTEDDAVRHLIEIEDVNRIYEMSSTLNKVLSSYARSQNFVIDSNLIKECYEYLFPTDVERFAYIEGYQLGNVVQLSRIIPVMMDQQSSCYVSGEIVSSTAALVGMCDRGYRLHATLHNHPGTGKDASHPSHIDIAHHRRLETGGYQAIGLIMTSDGHLRVYVDKLRYRLHVVGDEVKQIEDNLYKLEVKDEKEKV